jgi:replicative DNA helicase
MAASSQKIPPHDEQAEKSVLGGMLIDSNSLLTVAEILQPRHFYYDQHAKIYSAILGLFDKSKPIDMVTVAAELKEQGTLKGIGGGKYLSDLIEIVPSSIPYKVPCSFNSAATVTISIGLLLSNKPRIAE